MGFETIVAAIGLISTLLSGVVSALASKGSTDLIERVLHSLRNLISATYSERASDDGLWRRLREVRLALIQQTRLARAYSFASGILTFGQFVIGGLLASSFLQESLSKQLIGGLGLLVLVSSLIRQYYRPDVQAYGARRRVARLKDLERLTKPKLAM